MNARAGQTIAREALRRPVIWTVLCSASLIALSAGLGHAQQPGGIVLDPINVEAEGAENPKGPGRGIVATRTESATKTNTPRIETPQAVSVITRDQMQILRPKSVLEATRYSPAVRENSGGTDTRTDLFRIRGFSAEASGLFLNGLQLPSPGFAIFRLEPYGLDRIEVLRGPSAALYGGSSVGGLINAISKRPTFTPFGEVEIGINQYGNRYGAFDVGGPITSGAKATAQWAYRFTGLGKMGGTQTDFIDDDRIFVAPAVSYRPSLDTTFTLLAQFQKDRTNNIPFLPYVGTVRPASFGFIPTSLNTGEPGVDKIEREQAMLGYEFEHRVNDVFTARQNARYSYVHTAYYTPVTRGYLASPPNAVGTMGRLTLNAHPTAAVFNVDNQLEARFATGPLSHTVLFGVDLKHVTFNDRNGFGAAPSFNVLNPVYNQAIPNATITTSNDYTQRQLGVYVQDQIKLDRFTLVLSGRQDVVKTDMTNNFNAALNRASDESAFSGRAGLIYTSAIGLAPYVSYARSFEPVLGLAGTQLFVPETGEQYEVGVKFQPEGWKSFIGVAAFDLTRQNFLTSSPLPPFPQTQNGEARSRGIEIEAVAQLTDGFKLVGAFTSFDITNTQNLDPVAIGKAPVSVPEQFGSLFADYTFQSGALQGLGFGFGVRYNGPSFADVANTLEVPAYTLADATVHYEQKHWRAQLNVTNLFDKTYVGICASAIQCFYGERRKVMGSLAYKW